MAEKSVAQEYKEMFDMAKTILEDEKKIFLKMADDIQSIQSSRLDRHMISMIEMYIAKYVGEDNDDLALEEKFK